MSNSSLPLQNTLEDVTTSFFHLTNIRRKNNCHNFLCFFGLKSQNSAAKVKIGGSADKLTRWWAKIKKNWRRQHTPLVYI